ncbi:hypothetical protein ANO11243_092620 [Dothideomycetidae sp. 11243]|nr:hypothetical protein ANO11243_092620 [fungal sp. No.11243]
MYYLVSSDPAAVQEGTLTQNKPALKQQIPNVAEHSRAKSDLDHTTGYYWTDTAYFDVGGGVWTTTFDAGVVSFSGGAAAQTRYTSPEAMIPFRHWLESQGMYVHGQVGATYRYDGDGGWRLDGDGQMSFHIRRTSYWNIEYRHPGGWDTPQGWDPSWPPMVAESLSTINLRPLDFSLTHNLLFPGAFTFSPGGELAQPYDLVLVGNIKASAHRRSHARSVALNDAATGARSLVRRDGSYTDAQLYLAKEFIDQLNTPKITFGDLANAMIHPNTSLGASMYEPILAAHNFSSLSIGALTSLMAVPQNSSLAGILGRMDALDSRRSASQQAASVVYAPVLSGKYDIDQPASVADKQLIFDGQRAIVTFNGTTALARRDGAASLPFWTWTDRAHGKAFNITFATDLDPNDKKSVRSYFAGTVTTIASGDVEDFTGTQGGLDLTDVAKTTDTGGISTDLIISYTSLGIDIAALGFTIAFGVYSHKADNKLRKEIREHARGPAVVELKAQAAEAHGLVAQAAAAAAEQDRALQGEANRRSAEIFENHFSADNMARNPLFVRAIERAAEQGVQDNLPADNADRAQVERLQHFDGADGIFLDGPGLRVQEEAKEHVRRKIARYFEDHASPEIARGLRDPALLAGVLQFKLYEDGKFEVHARRFVAGVQMSKFIKAQIGTEFLKVNLDNLERKWAQDNSNVRRIEQQDLPDVKHKLELAKLEIAQLKLRAAIAEHAKNEEQVEKVKEELQSARHKRDSIKDFERMITDKVEAMRKHTADQEKEIEERKSQRKELHERMLRNKGDMPYE